MSRGRGAREFFEVFSEGSKNGDAQKPSKTRSKKRRFVGSIDAVKGEFVPSPDSPNPGRPDVEKDVFPFASGKRPKGNLLSRNEILIKLTHDQIVVTGLIALSVLVVLPVVFYRLGKSRGRAERAALSVAQRDALQRTPALQMPTREGPAPARVRQPRHNSPAPKTRATVAPSNTKWTIAVLAYEGSPQNLRRAQDLADALSAMMGSTPVFIQRIGDKIVVCVGRFQTSNDEMLMRLQQTLRSMRYEERYQFKDCYPMSLR